MLQRVRKVFGPEPGPVHQDVFLIACEALKNAMRHANARQIRVMLCFGGDDFRLGIEDDGRGIDPEIQECGRPGHFGLSVMRERAARCGGGLTIERRRGGGPEMHLRIETAAYDRDGQAN